MVIRMKTTVELNDALLAAAKELARREGVTLRAILEAALRHELDRRGRRQPFTLRAASFTGRGLRDEFSDAEWSRVREAAYQGRGG